MRALKNRPKDPHNVSDSSVNTTPAIPLLRSVDKHNKGFGMVLELLVLFSFVHFWLFSGIFMSMSQKFLDEQRKSPERSTSAAVTEPASSPIANWKTSSPGKVHFFFISSLVLCFYFILFLVLLFWVGHLFDVSLLVDNGSCLWFFI